MAFKDFTEQQQAIQLLQRSLEQGRLAHAYFFTGHEPDELEGLARTLAKTLNCQRPLKKGSAAIDCCDRCLNCQKIEHGNHADTYWIRPESKSRVITIDQMRELMQQINLKPTEAEYKVAVIVAADRLNIQAANAFLKTLEEPPAKSLLILLTTEPQRMLETIRSRCLRLNFAGEGQRRWDPAQMEWLKSFSEMAATNQKSLLGRYRLMDVLLRKLNQMRETIEEALTARSPLQRYKDVEKDLQDKWEDELKAAIEAEYRRQRADLLLVLQWWLRDVWVMGAKGQSRGVGISQTQESGTVSREPKEGLLLKSTTDKLSHPGPIASEIRSSQENGLLSPALSSKGGEGEDTGAAAKHGLNSMAAHPGPLPRRGEEGRGEGAILSRCVSTEELLNFPGIAGTQRVAQRLSGQQAMENLQVMEQLQRWLGTNVQEALALEVGLLKLHL